MLILQIIIVYILLLPVPAVIGTIFSGKYGGRGCVLFSWVSGQILLWAGFHFLSIPIILMEQSFLILAVLFGIYTAALVAVAAILKIGKYRKRENIFRSSRQLKQIEWKKHYLLWVVFGVLLLIQLILTILMAYEEGDDAFYLAISVITESSDTMYQILPYTGATTGLDARHGLAPFPIWIAWLARVSGVHAVTIAQVLLPLVIILMTYAIYYLIGVRLFAQKEHKLPFFMILVELLVLFGGYSVYSAENFLLVRASQGKAVIANIILPFLFLLFILILEELQEKATVNKYYWILTALTMTSGCLCSTQGTILTCMMLGVMGLCTVCSYRKWKISLCGRFTTVRLLY